MFLVNFLHDGRVRAQLLNNPDEVTVGVSYPVDQPSARRFLYECADLGLFGWGQLLQRKGDRPQGAFVEMRRVNEPNGADHVLNFCAHWKWQTILPSLAYTGIPYRVFGERAGAPALMIACSRMAIARSGPSRRRSPQALRFPLPPCPGPCALPPSALGRETSSRLVPRP